MGFTEDLTKQITASLKAGDRARTSTLRLLLNAIKNREKELKRPLEEREAHKVVATLIRQRKDSIGQYRKGGREDLAQKEEAEIEILKAFLPAQLPEGEIRAIVEQTVRALGASGMKDMGRVMKAVMEKTAGRAEGSVVSAIVREILSKE